MHYKTFLSLRLTFILKSINYSYYHTKFDYIISYSELWSIWPFDKML